MRIIPLDECLKKDYFIRFLECNEMPQKIENPAFNCLSYPKKQDMLLFVNECGTLYKTKSGKSIRTKSGDAVYVPKGSEYRVECVEEGKDSSTLQINFLLFDEDFEPFILSDEIVVFSPKTAKIRTLFEQETLLCKDASATPSLKKSVLLQILQTLGEESYAKKIPSIIERGTAYLHSHYQDDPSVEELASLCHVCVEYFRIVFKRAFGQTPSEYKNALRLKKAEQYLLYSDLSVADISDALSFSTVSHFIKQFKREYGQSPLSYRNDFRKS